ncbi:NADAR family protein [Streptomyces sp. NPDC088812]|uniref:NADAR family protein n=1 Tax=Streptomyces sp. NPDC088812 TaxID=3365905 RepID=UPI0037F6ABFD
MAQYSQMPMFTGTFGFLSNFDETPFFVPPLGREAASGEHAFNALKTLDPAEQNHVLSAPTPGESKGRGRRVTLRPGWNTGMRVWAMQRVLMAKFAVPGLSQRLVATGDLMLVETNHWHDQFWGSCFCPKHEQVPGTNMLGELLMAIRAHHR